MNSLTFDLDSGMSSDVAQADQARMEWFSVHFPDLRPVLSAFLVSRTGGDLAAAEDCLQEVSVVLWKKFDPDWSKEDFRRFAFRCAGIEARAFHRKNRRLGKRIVYLAPDVVEGLGDEIIERDAVDPTASRRRLKALRLCLDALDAPQRELLDARYDMDGSDRSIADIARERGWKMDALYKRLERLRSALHRCILKRLKQSVA